MSFKRNIERGFRKALRDVYHCRKYIYVIIGIFVFFILLGYFNASKLIIFDDIIKDILSKVEGMGGVQLTLYIFWNNFWSAFFGFIFGIVLGIFPIFNALVNGTLIGYVMNKAVSSVGMFGALKLMPHGIFELPAIFISLGLGLRLGMFIFKKNKGKAFRGALFDGLNTFFFVVVPLLIIAAIVEGSLIAFFKGA